MNLALFNLSRNLKNVCFSTISGSIKTTKSRIPISHKSPLLITSPAIQRMKSLLKEKHDAIGLRIGVKTRGCNGLSYTLDYCMKKELSDVEVIQDDIKVYITAKAQLTLLGTEMDYHEGKLVSEFVFYNPNVKGTCGCGESFNI